MQYVIQEGERKRETKVIILEIRKKGYSRAESKHSSWKKRWGREGDEEEER